MPFIHVKDIRLDAERVKRFHSADPEHDFLAHRHFEVAAIKLGGQQSVLGAVFRRVCIEKVNADPTHTQLPNLGENFATQHRHRNEQGHVATTDFAYRQMIKALIQTNRFLNAFFVDLLPEIAVPVEKADPDKV